MKLGSIALCLILVSCAQTEDTPPPTPQVTADDSDGDLRAILPSTEDVNAAYGDPGLFEAVPVDDASLYDNPDPRGPCGAKIAQPPLQDGAVATFQSISSVRMLFYAVAWDLPPGEAASFVRKHLKDMDPGCPAFTSQTPFNAKQRVSLLGEIEIPKIGDLRLATSSRIQVNGQPPAYASGFVTSDGTRLILAVVLGGSEPSERFLRGLVDATAKRLESD